MTEGIIKTTSAPCVAVGSEIMTDGERTDYEEFVRNARQKPLVIDKGEAPKGRRWMSQFWAMTYRELVVYAEHSWTDLNKREESIARLSGVVRWANDGYTTLEARDDLYAAALMCTSADEVGMGDVPLPSTSMVFRVSPGLVDVEYARLDAFKCAGRTAYSGHHKLCERCGLRKTIEHNVKHQLDLERTLKAQRARLVVLDAAAQATLEDRKLIAGINKRILKQNKEKR